MAFNKGKATSGAVSGAGAGASFGPWGAVIGGVGGGLLGGLYGGDDGAAERKRQDELMEQTLAEMSGISVPELRQIQLENPQWLEDLQAEQLDPSAMQNINTDSRLRSQQMASIAALEDIQKGGGLNAADRANLAQIQNDAATSDRGRRESIQQNMQQRGMGGSGLDLLAQLQSSQGATDRQAQQGLNVAGMAQNRALDAIMQSGNLAGSIRGQDFSEQAKKADAADAIARFNAQNRQQVNQFNVGGRQDMSNQQTTMRNQNQMLGNEIAQQNFNNQMNKAESMGNVRNNQVNEFGRRRSEEIQTQANTMAGMGKVGTSVGQYYQNKNKKNNNDENGGW